MKTLIQIEEYDCYYKMGIEFIKSMEKEKGNMSLKT